MVAPSVIPVHNSSMQRRLWVVALAGSLAGLGCSEDASTSGWSYGPSGADAGSGGSDASSGDAADDAADVIDGGTADTGGKDAVADVTGPDAAPLAPVVYPSDRTHSPVTPYVVSRMNEVLDRNATSRRDLFMKVGDSISASTRFLHCFADGEAELGAHGDLQGTLDAYASASIGGTTPFDRESASVEIGRTAYWAMNGSPSPLEQEMGALDAAIAVVMFGTNDIGWFNPDHLHTLTWYHGHMFGLVDTLLEAGIVPILSTLPPRDDDAALDAWIPTFNAVIRAMAQGRQMPLVDFHRELVGLPEHGLSADGVHPNAYTGGGDACTLTADGLAYGYNVRNWISLAALDRVRRAVIDGAGARDASGPVLAGQGTVADPFVMAERPFVDLRDSRDGTSDVLDTYGCSGADESGPEHVYRLEVAEPSRMRAVVLDRGDVDIDVHLLGATVDESGCLARGDTIVEHDLSPGTYHLVIDTFVRGGEELGGEYLLAVLVCGPGDPACVQ